MSSREEEFLKRLQETFRGEADEHLKAISSGLLEMEQGLPAERLAATMEVVYREAHSLKGAARAVECRDIESVCRSLESMFAALKRRDITLTPQLIAILQQTVDAITQYLLVGGEAPKAVLASLTLSLESAAQGAAAGQPTGAQVEPTPRPATSEPPAGAVAMPALPLTSAPAGAMPGPAMPEPRPARPPEATHTVAVNPAPLADSASTPLADTVRIAATRLDALLVEAEQLIGEKLSAGERLAEMKQIRHSFREWAHEWTGVRDLLPQDGGSPLSSFLEWNQAYVRALEGRLAALTAQTERDYRSLGGRVDELLADIKETLMLPFSGLLESFPRLVRELARAQHKEAELTIEGGQIEIDRRILQGLKDPLMHLVRNAVDHGIEPPEVRLRKGKAPRGNITLSVSQLDSGKVQICIADDGGGVAADKVRDAAGKAGVIAADDAQNLDDEASLALIFRSGVSTSPIITDLSGRGLGLAIVWDQVARMGGTVSLETRVDQGTTFRLVLPLTLATFRGVLLRVGEMIAVLPTNSVQRVLMVDAGQIKTVENQETIQVAGHTVALLHLAQALGVVAKAAPVERQRRPAVLLGAAEHRIAYLVDEVLGEQEVLVKGLGQQLGGLRYLAGATVLAGGRVAPILNVTDLLSAPSRAPAPAKPATVEAEEAKKTAVLVAEDSITARALLKSVLEAAGFDVRTAVDGADAFNQLRAGHFDIVISDVDMPRMSGFELTSRIRHDKRLHNVPLVLVTALESREDRERGVDVGANAYIVKSGFDQGTLIDVIRRLV